MGVFMSFKKEMDFSEFNKKFFRLVEKEIPKAAEKGAFNAANELLRDADKQPPQTPKEFGDLRGSRKVDKPKISRGEISVKAGYTSKYAVYQHEAEPGQFNYTTDKGVTQPGPKFLQSKVIRNAKRYIEIIVLSIKNARA